MIGNLSGQQFHQLPMFMSAREIQSQYGASPADREDVRGDDGEWRSETNDEVWSRKADETRERGLDKEIARNGVPGVIGIRPTRGYILDGHHRVGYMGETDPDRLMAVDHRWPERR